MGREQENIELVQRGFAHLRATGAPPQEIFAPDFVWDMSTFRGWPEQPTYVGIDGVRAFLADWIGAFDDWEIEFESVHAIGDKVVWVGRQRGRAKTTGAMVDMLIAQVFTIRDGIQTRMEMYADPEEAFSATGLAQAAG